ncbi:MAG: right-handed parallel beta-helix repeat-containing protein [Steroidobacteraceae bacterium]|nr:right-handed parallel beta-helix repeat-containing protein [Steroidobacteraceae bacterium]MDW8260539.1 right-handed parallel beta-helix repeat-containing protein [Gammaproteobacteria bacterium]
MKRVLGLLPLLLAALADAQAATIQGVVFEDVNYGGGAGRPRSAAGAVGINGVRVEFYRINSAGTDYTWLGTTTTSTIGGVAGSYSFTYGGGAGQDHAPVTVRVVNGTVRSSRTGGSACTTCVPVQTFRVDGAGANNDTVVAVTNRVGGQNPAISDAPSNTTNANLSALTTATQTPQSIAVIDPAAGGSTVSDVDFGFNFSTIVNVRDAASCAPSGSGSTFFPCQGALRQFLINANALGGQTSLAQAGNRQLDGVTSALPAGVESTIFMVPDGIAKPGQHPSYANALNGSGVAEITLATALPSLAQPNVRLDATTQTVNVGNTNAGTLGSGGTVGVDNLSLPLFQRPEVQLNCAASAAPLTLSASNQAIHGFALRQGYILLSGSGNTARNNLVGMTATGSSADNSPAFYGISFLGANSAVRGNFVTVNNSGIRSDGGGSNSIVSENEVARPSTGHTSTFDGILLISGSNGTTVRGNLVRDQRGGGIELGFGAATDLYTNVLVTNNTVRNNGYDSGTTPSSEDLGMVAYNLTGNNLRMTRNRVVGNAGPGIVVLGATGVTISENSFSSNRGLAIDLDPNTRDPNGLGTPNGVTLNDAGDVDTGPNTLLNYPILTQAVILGGQLQISGFARPGSLIELYIAEPDPTGFGEGLTYLTSLTEGAPGVDLDAGTGTYGPGPINGRAQGTDTTNRFRFVIPLPGGVTAGTQLTATATLAGHTSEFDGIAPVTNGPSLVHRKLVTVTADPLNGASNPKSIPGAEQLYTIRITNTASGTVDGDSIAIVDPIPANTRLFVGDLGGPASGPVLFSDGTPGSGLSFSFLGLGSAADSVDFSDDNGASWTYTPTPDAAGYDARVTHLRVRPGGTMSGASGTGNPFFELRFRVRVD